MAISFTAEYLYQGARLLSSNPPEDYNDQNLPQNGDYELFYAIARGVYALGIAVIAPLGALYHLGAAAICAVQCESAQEHLDAAVCDLRGFRDIAPQVGLIAMAILSAIVLNDLLYGPSHGYDFRRAIILLQGLPVLVPAICSPFIALGCMIYCFYNNDIKYDGDMKYAPSVAFAFRPEWFANYLPADRQHPAALADG